MTLLVRMWLAAGLLMFSTACTRTVEVPGPAVEVQVPIPVPCRIEPVEVPVYPASNAMDGMGLWQLTQLALADRQVRMAENARLRASNNNPCTGEAE